MLHTLPDVVGASAASAPLVAAGDAIAPQGCQWVQLAVTGSGTVRIGDSSSVSSTVGFPITSANPVILPYKSREYFYFLNQIWAYVPTGSTLSIAYDA